jgi:hypothetical protein
MRRLLEKVTTAQLVEKFPVCAFKMGFHRTLFQNLMNSPHHTVTFITVFRNSLHTTRSADEASLLSPHFLLIFS